MTLLAALLAFPATARTDEPPPNLEQLWNQYPLAPAETEPADEPEKPRVVSPPTPPPEDASSPWGVVLAFGAVCLAVVIAATSFALLRSRRRRGMTATRAIETPEELIARAYALAKEAEECDKFLHGQRQEGMERMTETVDQDRASEPEPTPERSAKSYTDIGERVAGVLAAAEAAATQIREDARALADDLLNAARDEAAGVRHDAASYDTDTRAAVDSYASDRRREVDQEVQKQLADSEAQARATRQAAEAMARQIEEDGRRRGQALRDESQVVEERLKKAAAGLRRMTAEIDELLGPSPREGETLTDALRPYARQDEAAPAGS